MSLYPIMTRKIWVQVDTIDNAMCSLCGHRCHCDNTARDHTCIDHIRPYEDHPKLVGGLDPDRARKALLELTGFKPEYGPKELFNDENPYYRKGLTLVQIAVSRGYNAEAFEWELRNRAHERIEKQPEVADGSRAREWAGHSKNPEDYLPHRKARIDDVIKKSIYGEYGLLSPTKYVMIDSADFFGMSTTELHRLMLGDEDAPFFSEAYLYTLVGKDIARSILGRIRELQNALGIE